MKSSAVSAVTCTVIARVNSRQTVNADALLGEGVIFLLMLVRLGVVHEKTVYE